MTDAPTIPLADQLASVRREIGQGELSAAIRLGVFGFGRIAGQPQAVTLTAEGRAWRAMGDGWAA